MAVLFRIIYSFSVCLAPSSLVVIVLPASSYYDYLAIYIVLQLLLLLLLQLQLLMISYTPTSISYTITKLLFTLLQQYLHIVYINIIIIIYKQAAKSRETHTCDK